jgi:hypothetical protein
MVLNADPEHQKHPSHDMIVHELMIYPIACVFHALDKLSATI